MKGFFKKKNEKHDLLLWGGILLFILIGGVVFLQNLGYLSLWMDEGFHAIAVQEILDHGYPLFPSGHVYYKAILYTYVLALFSLVFGLSEFSLRIVSVLCFLAAIPLMFSLCKRLFTRTIAVGAVLLFVLSAWETEFARLALYFSPLQFWSLLSFYCFYKGYVEDDRKYKTYTVITFVLIPYIHQLGMWVIFCFPALLLLKGVKRFFKKDVLIGLAITAGSYLLVQIHEFFFWQVGYVYEKTDASLRGMLNYFFSGFSLDYFKEFYRSFPLMSLVVFAGFFLYLGSRLAGKYKSGSSELSFGSNWYLLNLVFVFPVLFMGIFRTHVQPRYLYQLHPLFLVLFAISLFRIAQVILNVSTAIFSRNDKTPKHALSVVLFFLLLFFTAEGAGVGKVFQVVNRNYRDPVPTDVIARSGRFEHYDHKGPGEFVRHHLRETDVVIAIHVVFQHIYAGRVDYWLWSGGPGTWDAWEKTSEGWKDFYVGARWINNLGDLKKIIEQNRERRIWIIASPSIRRRDHIKAGIADFIQGQEENLVFKGKDGLSEVYLWHDREQNLTGPLYSLEGEWLPVRFGRIVYTEDSSRGSALCLNKNRDGNQVFRFGVRQEFASGRYTCVFRVKTDNRTQVGRTLGLAVFKRGADEPLGSRFINGDMIDDDQQYQDFKFDFYLDENELLDLKLLYSGQMNLWLDFIDFQRSPGG